MLNKQSINQSSLPFDLYSVSASFKYVETIENGNYLLCCLNISVLEISSFCNLNSTMTHPSFESF